MDYGQLPTHRPFDPRPPRFETRSGPFSETRFHVGAPQWTVPEWIGKTYPPGAKPAEYLRYYSRQWDSIELNTSFYNVPSVDQVRKWAATTAPSFRFFVKVFQGLSHKPDAWASLEILRSRMSAFTNAWRELGPRLGGFFLQLPPEFSPERAASLSQWLSIWPRDLALAVEFRHPAWFRERSLAPGAQAILKSAGAGTVICDTPGRRDASHGTLTNGKLFVRFLGQSTSKHEAPLGADFARVRDWAAEIAVLTGRRDLEEAAFFVHTPDSFWVPELTRAFLAELESRGVRPGLKPPEAFVAPQMSLF